MSADRATAESLLARASLPLAGFADHLADTVVAEAGGQVVGCVTVERYGEHGLLRSLVVEPTWRGRGVGAALVLHAVQRARASGMGHLWLLTTAGHGYFPRLGFREVRREELPNVLSASAELRGACPASATAMHREIAIEDPGARRGERRASRERG